MQYHVLLLERAGCWKLLIYMDLWRLEAIPGVKLSVKAAGYYNRVQDLLAKVLSLAFLYFILKTIVCYDDNI
jgi:hypothetical protein